MICIAVAEWQTSELLLQIRIQCIGNRLVNAIQQLGILFYWTRIPSLFRCATLTLQVNDSDRTTVRNDGSPSPSSNPFPNESIEVAALGAKWKVHIQVWNRLRDCCSRLYSGTLQHSNFRRLKITWLPFAIGPFWKILPIQSQNARSDAARRTFWKWEQQFVQVSLHQNGRLHGQWREMEERHLILKNVWICFRISSSFVGNNPQGPSSLQILSHTF